MQSTAQTDTATAATSHSDESPRTYEVRRHAGEAALGTGGDAFDSLARAEGAPVCARRDWLSIWSEAHPEWRLLALEVRGGDGATVAAAILARRRRLGFTQVVLAGAGDCDMASLPVTSVTAAEALSDALAAELDSIRGPWRLSLDQVPAGSPVPALLRGRLRTATVADGDPVPRTEVGSDRGLASYLSQRFRKETRRRRRRFEEQHRVEVDFLTTPGDVAAAVDSVARLRRERDHDLSRPSTLDAESGAAFWHGVVDHFGAAGELELALLRADGRPAAYVISILDTAPDGAVVYRGWDGRIATEFARFAPGQILDVAVLEHVLEQTDAVLVDYGRGAQEQKLHYANTMGETAAVRAWSSPWLHRWDTLLAAAVAALRSFKEGHPGLERRWREVKRSVLRSRSR